MGLVDLVHGDPTGAPSIYSAAEGVVVDRVVSRAALARALLDCEEGHESELSLIATTIRRVLALRGSVLQRALVGDVARLLAPALEDGNHDETVGDVLGALADLGDIVLIKRGERVGAIAELASGTLVTLPEGAGAIVLGRLEAALPTFVRMGVKPAGIARWVGADDLTRELLEEISFNGCRVLRLDEWCQRPTAQPAALLLARRLETAARYAGDGSAFEVFDPHRSAWIYRERFRTGALSDVLARDGWAAAREQRPFGPRSYSLFGIDNGQITRADVAREEFARVCGACAALSIGGERHLVRRTGECFRIHFPPPPWLSRLLSISQPEPRCGALLALRVPGAITAELTDALDSLLFCEVRQDEEPRDVRRER